MRSLANYDKLHVLCSPVFCPHIVGGEIPPGFVTSNLSVVHLVEPATGFEFASSSSFTSIPFKSFPTTVVSWFGPKNSSIKSKTS